MPYEDDYKMWLEEALIRMNPDWVCDEMSNNEFTHNWCHQYCGEDDAYITPKCLHMYYHHIVRADRKTEPQTCSVNGRPYDCGNCEYHKCTADEPQTDCTDNCHKCNRIRECGYPLVGKCEYEPQTERPCDNCQEFDCYGCEYKQTERSK